MKTAIISVEAADECGAWLLAIGFSHVTSLVIWKIVLSCERRTPGMGSRNYNGVQRKWQNIRILCWAFPGGEEWKQMCVKNSTIDVLHVIFSSDFSVYLWPWCKSVLNLFFISVTLCYKVLYMTRLYICTPWFYNILLCCTSCDHFSPIKEF